MAKSIGIGIGFLSCIGIGIVKTIFEVLVLVLLRGFPKYWYWYCKKVLVLVLGLLHRSIGIGIVFYELYWYCTEDWLIGVEAQTKKLPIMAPGNGLI